MMKQRRPADARCNRRRKPPWLLAAFLILVAAGGSAEQTDSVDIQPQKTTIEIMRTIGPGLQLWSADQRLTSPAGRSKTGDKTQPFDWAGSGCEVIDLAALEELLVPKYAATVPARDGWNHPLEYCVDRNPESDGSVAVGVRSTGSDGKMEGNLYLPSGFDSTEFDRDIVWANGYFVTWPTSKQPAAANHPVELDAVGDWTLEVSDAESPYVLEETGTDGIELRAIAGSKPGRAVASQSLSSSPLKGKTVLLRAEVRGSKLDGIYGLFMGGPGIGFKVDKSGPVEGTRDWGFLEVEATIPSAAQELSYGVVLDGPGSIEVRKISLRLR